MSPAFDDRREPAPFAAMLSVSTSSIRPARRSPKVSTTRRIPSSSRQLIGRLCSALLKRNTISSRAPSIHASCPVPQPLASVPDSTASASSGISHGTLKRSPMWSLHHCTSRQKPADSCTVADLTPSMVTMPLLQSTSHPANDDSIACMNGLPFHTTCDANTSLPKRTASSLGFAPDWLLSSRRRDSQSSNNSKVSRRLLRVSEIPRCPSTFDRSRPKNSMAFAGPRYLCGAH